MTDTIVLGLDGANWALLEPWLAEGELPNIEALRDDGVWTDMLSCLPPVTCPNWRCYSTGKNPGKLGVFWWERIDTDDRSLTTPTSRSFKSANYWEYLNDAGLSAGVMNLPMTYPPFELDGFMIAGGPGSEQDSYAHPRELGAELDVEGYRLHPGTPVASKTDFEAAERVVDLIDDRLETFRELLTTRDVDVAHLTVFYINVLQHFFWRGEPTKQGWQVIDEHIGAIREEHPDATLMLMSDHGCTDIETVFFANSWLEEAGYLVTKDDTTSNALLSLGINKESVSHLAHRLGIHDLLTALTPDSIKNRVPDNEAGFRREQKLEHVDWEHSRAIASGQGLIYLIDDDPETRAQLIDDLRELRSPITGEPIACEVLTSEEAYSGPYVDVAPDVVFDQQPGVHTSDVIGSDVVFSEAGQWEAENVRTGLFLAAGPDVTAEQIEGPISITDVAPTVLHSVGCAVPTDVDGRPVPLFDHVDVAHREPIPYDEGTSVGSSAIQDRLSDLGYLE